MKKLTVLVSLAVLLGSVSPVLARTSQDALYVGAGELEAPNSLMQIIAPVAESWRKSSRKYSARFPYFIEYQARKEKCGHPSYCTPSTYVETLTDYFIGDFYRDEEADYISLSSETWDRVRENTRCDWREIGLGYFIASHTFSITDRESREEIEHIEVNANELKSKTYTEDGVKYVVLTIPRLKTKGKK